MNSSRSRIRSFVAGCAVIWLTGCATIVGDTDQRIAIESTPDGAQVEIRDRNDRIVERNSTPFSVVLDKSAGYFRGQKYTVAFSMDGHESREVEITARPNGWYLAGNFVFGGVIGWLIVDPLTGAMWSLSPDEIDSDLGDAVAGGADDAGSLHVSLLQDAPEAVRERMVPVH